jgi:hypothetical protein
VPVPTAPTQPATRTRRLRLVIVAAVLVAAIAAIVTVLVSGDDSGGGDPEASFPAEWDTDVAPLAQFVERELQTTFRNPVHVDFLAEDEYAARAEEIVAEPTNGTSPLLGFSVGVQRALGLVQGDADLAGAAQALEASRPALYSTTSQRVVVRGEQLDQGVRVAIVRALALALDQQTHGLLTEFDDAQAEWAYHAMRVGNAQRVASQYVAALDPAERTGIEDPYAADVAGATEVVRVLAQAPSVLGEQFVRALLADGGNEALTRAFDSPPFSEEHLYDATAFLNGDDPKERDTPRLEPGETEGEAGTFGVLSWLVVLGEHSAPDVAVRAANGWGGDAWATYEFQDRDCLRIQWTGDSREDVDELSQAAAAWVTAMPPGGAQYTNENGVITLSTCDPGSGEPITTGTSADTFAFVALRASVFADQLTQDKAVDAAWCVADQAANGSTLEEARDPGVLDSPEYQAKIAQYETNCA